MNPDRWQQISQVFQAALARDAQQRTRFLDDACAGDPALRREVESLLGHRDNPDKFLAERAAPMAAMVLADAPSHDVLEGQFGAYTIVSPLGAGGMGVVYRARDAKLGRDVALKVLPQELANDPERRTRLLREARVAASLNHPNICTVHEVGEAEGHAYIAMELVEGKPLSSYLAEGPLPPAEVLRYGIQLADAMAHAHDRGLAHRDLKTANVMVTPEGRIKVLDFGLAKRLAGEELAEVTTPAHGSLTHPGAIVGTLPYMSPEQLRGQSADARSDVWALGVVLYEMAAGVRPFKGPTGYELSAAIFHEPPPPLPPRVAVPLQNVIGRCLEKEPARRYQRGGEVRAALETLGADVPANVRRWPSTARHATWLVGAFSLVMVLAFIGAAIWWQVSPWNLPAVRRIVFGQWGGQIRSLAVLPLENLSRDPNQDYFVAGMHEGLITDLAQIGLEKVIAKPSSDAFKNTKKPLRDIGRELGVEALVIGSVMRADDRVRVTAQLIRADSGVVLWANRYERNAGDVLSLQNELVAAIAREVQATITPNQSARLATPRRVDPGAQDAYLKGRFYFANFSNSFDYRQLDEAIAEYEKAIQIDPTFAAAYAALGYAHEAESGTSLRAPKESYPKARTAALRGVELDETLAEAHAALAWVLLWFDWNWAGAEREIGRALQLNPNSVDALTASEVYSALVASRYDAAAATSRRIFNLDPLNPFSRMQAGWVAFNGRRYDDSIRELKSLLELYPDHMWGHFFLALPYAAKHMSAEVDAECRKVMALLSGTYGVQPMGICGWALGTAGQTAQARRLVQALEDPPAGIWPDPVFIGNAYVGVGDIDRAVAWYQKGMEERSPNMLYIKDNVTVDPLRGDPRFQVLLSQMNFPK